MREKKKIVRNHLDRMGTISPDLVQKIAEDFTEMTRRAKSKRLIRPSGKELEKPLRITNKKDSQAERHFGP